jgi:Spy/CpxP family protein refolding chaperone
VEPQQAQGLTAEPAAPEKAEKDKRHERHERRDHERQHGRRGAAAQVARIVGRELRLAREQSDSLRELLRTHAEELRAGAREFGEARRALREKALADTIDEAAIKSASERLGAAIGSSSALIARIAAEVRPPLSPRQRERLRTLSGRWEARRDRWRARIEHWNGD